MQVAWPIARTTSQTFGGCYIMSRLTRAAFVLVVVISVGLPDLASAQAKSRGSGSVRSGSSRGTSVSRAPSRPAPSRKVPARPRAPQGSGAKSNQAGLQMARSPGLAGTATSRDRNGRPTVGQAVPRPTGVLSSSTLVFSPSNRFGLGVGLRSGFGFGSRPFGLSRYGFGGNYGYYDPWLYGAYGYPAYGYGYRTYGYMGNGGNGASGSQFDNNRQEMGSVRLRMSPRTAKVYIDGALAGTVDDFDGLTGHLELPVGSHQLELRADGYDSYKTEFLVVAGRTMTERAELKRLIR